VAEEELRSIELVKEATKSLSTVIATFVGKPAGSEPAFEIITAGHEPDDFHTLNK
jgi:hypothetical protein